MLRYIQRVISSVALIAAIFALVPNSAVAEFGEPTLVTHSGFYHKMGPEKATGVIVWSPGADAENIAHPKAKGAGMPHFLDWLYGHGWDVFYMQRTGGLHFSDRPRHAAAIQNAVYGLKIAGYQQIVLAGQSSGGLYSMLAAADASVTAPLDIHALLLMASGPSAGPFTFEELLTNTRADRFIVMHFANDDLIGSRDPQEIEVILRLKRVPYLNIFEPQGIEGHGGGYLSTFSKRFADCLLEFLNSQAKPMGQECAGRSL